MRELGKASSSGGKGKEDRIKTTAEKYVKKAKVLNIKLKTTLSELPLSDMEDLVCICKLENFIPLLEKHIDLVTHIILQDQEIPHDEKLFSLFETYTEWVKKEKKRPSVELGKKLNITTDLHHLIT